MTELKTFDFTGAMGRGLQLGQGIRQQQNQGKLAALLGQARTASGPQRDALMGQAYGVDPAAGMAAEQQMGKLDEMKAKRLGQMASIFTSVDPQQRAAMWPTIRQELSQIIPGAQYPDMWDESLLPQAQAIAQQLGSLTGGTVQSRFVAEDGRVLALMRDGSIVDTGEKADRQMWLRDHPGMAPHLVGKDAQIRPIGGQQAYAPQAPQQPGQMGGGAMFAGLEAIPGVQVTSGFRTPEDNERVGGVANSYHKTNQARDILPPRTPEQAQQIQQFAAQNGLEIIDEGDHWHLEPRGGGQQSGGLARPSEAQVAGEQERAKQQAQIDYLPQRQALETQDAIERTRGTEQVKADVGKQAGRSKAKLALDQAQSRVQRVDALVDSIIPRIGPTTAGFIGDKLSGIAGTPAFNVRKDLGTLQAIAGFDELNAMRASSPTGGALGNVTERELAFLQSVIRNIENSQSPDQLKANLEAFRDELRGSWKRVNEAYEQDFSGGDAAPSNDIDGLLGKYGIR